MRTLNKPKQEDPVVERRNRSIGCPIPRYAELSEYLVVLHGNHGELFIVEMVLQDGREIRCKAMDKEKIGQSHVIGIEKSRRYKPFRRGRLYVVCFGRRRLVYW